MARKKVQIADTVCNDGSRIRTWAMKGEKDADERCQCRRHTSQLLPISGGLRRRG